MLHIFGDRLFEMWDKSIRHFTSQLDDLMKWEPDSIVGQVGRLLMKNRHVYIFRHVVKFHNAVMVFWGHP